MASANWRRSLERIVRGVSRRHVAAFRAGLQPTLAQQVTASTGWEPGPQRVSGALSISSPCTTLCLRHLFHRLAQASSHSTRSLHALHQTKTLRQIVHTSIGGPRVTGGCEQRFSGRLPLQLAALISLCAKGLDHRSRSLTFGGQPTTRSLPAPYSSAIRSLRGAPGRPTWRSSLYLPRQLKTFRRRSRCNNTARQTNYVSETGNYVGTRALPVAEIKPGWFVLSASRSHRPGIGRAIVAFGASITDGTRSTP